MTDRHPDKQNGMTIRLTLCERDAIIHKTQLKEANEKLLQISRGRRECIP